jgi:MSHA pilin protein MshC
MKTGWIIATQAKLPSKKTKGFTLIELVAVIVLIGILATYVAPKFSGRSGIAEYTLRDQIISTLRFAQQRAMYDHSGSCYGVVIDSDAAIAVKDGDQLIGTQAITFSGDYQGYTATPTSVFFDGMGNPKTGGADCASATVSSVSITVSSSAGAALQIAISAAGYVEKI